MRIDLCLAASALCLVVPALAQAEMKPNPQTHFAHGMAAKANGNCGEALAHFKSVLELDPTAQRAKLEMADCHAQAGDHETARNLFMEVRSTNPPDLVRQNIDQYLALLAQGPKAASNWRLTGSVGYFYDSNANQGTDAHEVDIFGLPFELSGDARKRGDHGYQISASIEHVAPIDTTTHWQSAFALNWRDYSELDAFDTVAFNVATGPVWQIGGPLLFSLPIIASGQRYESGGNYYSVLTGVAPHLRYAFNPEIALTVDATLGYKHFRDNEDRNGVYASIAPSVDAQLTSSDRMTAGVQFARENSGLSYWANDELTFNVSYQHQFSPGLAVVAFASIGWAWYDGQEAAYDEVRKDDRYTTGADLIIWCAQLESDLILSASYTINNSNLELYEFDRLQTTVALRRRF